MKDFCGREIVSGDTVVTVVENEMALSNVVGFATSSGIADPYVLLRIRRGSEEVTIMRRASLVYLIDMDMHIATSLRR